LTETTVLASGLRNIGLTDYEARSLIALMTLGVGTPRDVARESGIPYPSAYDSLRSLSQGGWVEFACTRPSIFRVREPALMKQKLAQNLGDLFDKLQSQYENVKDESSKLALIYTIVGRDHVLDKISELLDSAKSHVMIVIPSSVTSAKSDLDRGKLNQALETLLARNQVTTRIISDSQSVLKTNSNHCELRVRIPVLAIDLLVDDQKALIGLPDLSVCGWVDSPIIASHFGQFLDLLWRDSRQARIRKGRMPDKNSR
jgi:sugar-specific transcriptional regulator TrmB